MQIQSRTLPPMVLTSAQKNLLIGMRVFLGLLTILAVYDFAIGIGIGF